MLLKNFKPIETIIDGLPVGRGAIVAITGPTGHAKTTVCTLLEVSLLKGLPFAGREVTQGSVLVLAGENPHDYTMHLAGQAQELGLYPAELARPDAELLVVPGTFAIDYELDYLSTKLKQLRANLVAVFVDTSAAFFNGTEENGNVEMRRHASMLRDLASLPGNPTVFVLCHPTKNAQRDNLLPRGGGAFLAEIDCNLTLWKEESGIVSLHWAGKIRGPSFDPVRFELAPVTLEGHVDCRGKPITSVVARYLPDDRAEQLHAKAIDDDDTMLIAMQRKPGGSVRDLATACGWTNGVGKPMHARADRKLKGLAALGLAEQDRKGTWRLTKNGKTEADRLR
ncbi:hypothetical protein ASC76_17755 [Rhizobacter sp. Root404]|nr:hypothetical protein ASC76_17755 [Rhizobacter sp. Root404]